MLNLICMIDNNNKISTFVIVDAFLFSVTCQHTLCLLPPAPCNPKLKCLLNLLRATTSSIVVVTSRMSTSSLIGSSSVISSLVATLACHNRLRVRVALNRRRLEAGTGKSCTRDQSLLWRGRAVFFIRSLRNISTLWNRGG